MNFASSLDRNKRVFATSVASVKRPSGTLLISFARFSVVSGTPANVSKLELDVNLSLTLHQIGERAVTHRPVPLNSGQTEFTLI